MRRKVILIILTSVILFALLVKLITVLYLESFVKDKIQSSLNKTSNKYTIEIKKVNILYLRSGIELKSISVYTDTANEAKGDLNGMISSVRITGVRVLKAVFRRDYHCSRLVISEPVVVGNLPFPDREAPAIISTLHLRIDIASFDSIGLDLRNLSNAKAYRLKNGSLKLFGFHIAPKDTISQHAIGQLQFNAEEIQAVSADSTYTITADSIHYSALSKILEIKEFSIQPNLSDRNFMARFRFETDKIDARFHDIFIHDFPAIDYVKSGTIFSSFIKISNMDIQVYRDKRKKFNHTIKPIFQEMIYDYKGELNIDSIGILQGNVVYTEMVDDARAYGMITFSGISSSIYKISNDTTYKEKEAFLLLRAKGMFMDKSPINILLKAKLFEKQNTFTMSGNLSDFEVKELNPMLENSAFLIARAGKIDGMNFYFVANNTKATGRMKLLYHGLEVTVLNKKTGDSTGIKQKIITFIANRKLIDANPLPGKEVREGEIDHKRDPERFLINYCFKSVFSGIRTTILKNPPEEKKPED